VGMRHAKTQQMTLYENYGPVSSSFTLSFTLQVFYSTLRRVRH
jgi:hypothetical protein